MYGMVNKAIEELITVQYGEAVWKQVCDKAGLEDTGFVSTRPYPDSITYRLVSEASEILQVSQEDILKQFGRWWILHTSQRGYGHLMKAGGRTLGDFLVNLPNFHTRIVLMFPELKPPEFECSDVSDTSVRLHYHSTRKGLSAFVVGLLEGLGGMFGMEVQVTHEEKVEAGSDHDVFWVAWPAAVLSHES